MIILKYINNDMYHEVSFKRIAPNIVEVGHCIDRGLGFETFNGIGEKLGDFSEYRTVYREIDEYTVQYSNDYSVYVEPEPFIPRQPTAEEIKQMLIDGVQNFMDETAAARGYDGILSVCSYIDTGVERFDTEGAQARRWRSAVWAYCYAQLELVLAGEREIPTLEELIAELPVLDWQTK